ncbi:MAG: hypothetical protein QM767_22770 [Anaeromyxobacter sp.]
MKLRRPALAAALALLAACNSSSGAATTPPVDPPPPLAPGPLFTGAVPWNDPVDAAPLSDSSTAMLDALESAGGWGMGNVLRIDFSLAVIPGDANSARVPLVKRSGYWAPDCDDLASFPLPAGGAAEGSSSYACSGGDCHVLVVDQDAGVLYESYISNQTSAGLQSRCAVAWDLGKDYGATLRGDQCTSADAAGLPMAALLFTADEVAAGSIDHAIRFILPNERMRAGVYVRPATHAGAPSGGDALPPYGTRLRLRADYPLDTLPSDGARVVAVALQRYGMVLADGGNMALTAADDRFTAHGWDEVGIDTRSLAALSTGDFEVVDPGAEPIAITYDCVRVP